MNREFINKYFCGTATRIEGVGLEVIAREALARHRSGFTRDFEDVVAYLATRTDKTTVTRAALSLLA